MKNIWVEVNTSSIPFTKIIEHTKENIEFESNNKDDCENLDALIVNIKNALVTVKQDINDIDKNILLNYLKDIKYSKKLISFIIDKSIINIESIIDSLPKDNYDSMSKEELIALLREKQ